jgi:hypothetical protein
MPQRTQPWDAEEDEMLGEALLPNIEEEEEESERKELLQSESIDQNTKRKHDRFQADAHDVSVHDHEALMERRRQREEADHRERLENCAKPIDPGASALIPLSLLCVSDAAGWVGGRLESLLRRMATSLESCCEVTTNNAARLTNLEVPTLTSNTSPTMPCLGSYTAHTVWRGCVCDVVLCWAGSDGPGE